MSKDKYEKRIVEEHPDGTVERTVATGDPVIRERVIEPRIVKVKSGGAGAAWAVVALLVAAVGGLGWYIVETRDETVAVKQQAVEQQQQQAAMEQRLEDIGQRAADLNAEVRDAQRDMGAAPAPAAPTTQPAAPVNPAPTTPAPATPPQQ